MKGTMLALLYIKQKILNHFLKNAENHRITSLKNHISEKNHIPKKGKFSLWIYEWHLNKAVLQRQPSPHLCLTEYKSRADRFAWFSTMAKLDDRPCSHLSHGAHPHWGDLVILVPTQERLLPSTRKNSIYCDSGLWYSLSGPRIKIFPLLSLENNCLWASCGGAYLYFRKKDAEAGGLQRPTWDTGQVPGYL